MKKLVPLFALLLAALALAACGGGDDTSGDTSPVAGAVEEVEDKAGEAKDEVEDKAGEAKEEVEDKAGEAKEKAEGGSEGSGSTIDIEADPNGGLAFTSDEASAEAGKDTVNFTNSSPVPHDVRIEDSSGQEVGGTEVIAEGSESATVDLKPGEYTFFCSVPGHRQAGMEGTLTVK
ncbi:MAG TPA: plastocyanin/azurin family copper-binding protein [Solirubrobacterales bacterium]|nr:plastocyanin/azurin family copper-binding protein [Solirubrobacterales bacterium]